jgi:glycosyltransferase involved in cell wall biosynthesis
MVGLNIHKIGVSQMMEDWGITEEVIYPGFVSDSELNALYYGALGLISPSIYETVCLPVMEAQAVGKVVICPDTPGMREVTGGHALLLPESTVPQMSKAISRLATEAEERERMAREAKDFASRFTWQRSAKETLDALIEVGSR